ncbi:probable ATP-dependent RNA helicase Dbp73D [Toxorhynchites rutilus septentrionalis]|uniref:probable ATP-dependent RNA helicase Dbp73D n=1 Tax=Toxorhynchites rutilus septentrionalis TaxID=329112 RepID=UPI002479FFE3|nr:probable ATP-dependent RNA helicase Dbp73D [Toxorhynchites rutilus septentrionalis]
MELFAVNRYDETKLTKEDEQAQEELILQRLRTPRDKPKRSIKCQVNQNQIQDSQTLDHDITKNLEANEETEHVETEPGTQGVKDAEPTQHDQLEEHEPKTRENETNFVVLGDDHLRRLKKIDEVLPPWLSHPTIIDSDLSKKGKSIKKLDYLSEQIKCNLKKMEYKRLFPVQETVIPWILDAHRKPAPFWPRDVCISSPTGSGKTLAFAIPVVQLLLNRISPAIRAMVVLPVTELAEQVYAVFEKLCQGTKVRPLLLSRKQTFSVEQTKLVDRFNDEYIIKVDIVITTAGRLVEHLHSTKGFTLKHLRFLIIDEADRVMDQIQNDWLYHLNKHVKEESDEYLLGRGAGQLSQTEIFDKPRQPHKLLFSATMSRDPEKLHTFKLFHPKLFTAVSDPAKQLATLARKHEVAEEKRGKFVGQYATPAELRELICMTQYKIKPLTLFALLKENNYKRFLCFTNSIDASHRLSFVLQKMFGSDLIIEEWSSSLTPTARKNVLSRFMLGKVNGIICTDALARGIDIDDIDVVISYDAPRHINTYIHRIGRTGRAGNRGTSITMLIDEERKKFNTTLTEAGKRAPQEININSNAEEEYAVLYSNALNDLRDALDLEKQTINKMRGGMSIASMTKVNLLSKLKDRVEIDSGTSKETIKTLLHLPKAWSNEAIEKRANSDKGERKRKQKRTAREPAKQNANMEEVVKDPTPKKRKHSDQDEES